MVFLGVWGLEGVRVSEIRVSCSGLMDQNRVLGVSLYTIIIIRGSQQDTLDCNCEGFMGEVNHIRRTLNSTTSSACAGSSQRRMRIAGTKQRNPAPYPNPKP